MTPLRFPLILLVLHILSFISRLSYGGTAATVTPGPALLVLQTAGPTASRAPPPRCSS